MNVIGDKENEMKKFVKVVAVCALALSLSTVSAMAGDKFFQFSLIGHPGNSEVLKESADNSNGRAIMVPLQTKDYKGKKIDGEMVCEFDGSVLTATDEDGGYVTYVEDIMSIDGAKIYFIQSEDGFGIIDRDATDDGGAAISVPFATGPEGDQVWDYEVYVRVLGKPNKCMNVSGWASDGDNWFKAGDISFNRKSGKPVRVDANDLFTVDYCELETETTCVKGTLEEYSVFDSIFSEYAWNIQNDGVRNLQVRIYPKAPAPE